MRGLLVSPWITFMVVAHVQPGTAETMNARSYNGSGNNLDNPLWGSANYRQALEFFAVLFCFSCLRVFGIQTVFLLQGGESF